MAENGYPSMLVFLRHGPTLRTDIKAGRPFFRTAAERDRVAGTPDHLTSLTPAGRRRGKRAGEELKRWFRYPSEFIHSGYERTIQMTGSVLSAWSDDDRSRIRVWRDDRVRERDPGYVYDMTEREVQRAFPWYLKQLETAGTFLTQSPGGESHLQMADMRVRPFIESLRHGERGRTTIVVTHAGFIRAARYVLENLTYTQAEELTWTPTCAIVAYKLNDLGAAELITENVTLCP